MKQNDCNKEERACALPPPNGANGTMPGRIMYPGSFDPVTNGHLDVIRRAGKIFDEVLVAVGRNSEKNPWFTIDERLEILNAVCADLPFVKVITFEGLLVDAVRRLHARAVIRGLRAVSDFEFEFQMALMNRELNGDCETLFMMPSPRFSFVSSRMIREIAQGGGDVSPFVPELAKRAIERKMKS